MQRPNVLRVLSGAVALAASWSGAGLPALAADQAPPAGAQCADGACKMDDHGGKPGDAPGKRGPQDKGGCQCGANGQACACDSAGPDEAHGPMGEHGPMDRHGRKGHNGPMGEHGPRMGHGGMMAHAAKGPEIRYMPSALSAGGSGNQYVVLGGGMQMGGDRFFSLGFQHNVAIQLFNQNPNAGSWVAPYCGLLPRLGFTLGTARVDVGVLGGFGLMARTIGQAGADVTALDARFQWVLEPRIEIGTHDEHHTIGVVATYLETPNSQDLGGFSFGIHAAFKGMGW